MPFGAGLFRRPIDIMLRLRFETRIVEKIGERNQVIEKVLAALPGFSRAADWFAGKPSTRTATFWMRMRNSSGSESKVSSATLTKSSCFIPHH